MSSRVARGLALTALALTATGARGEEQLSLEIKVGWEWVRPPGSPGAAIAVRRALDRRGRPASRSTAELGCDPRLLRRRFRLHKNALLLGEPILVEFQVAVAPGAACGGWREPVGGNYRGRGRDDNFIFLLRAADGSWVADPYGPEQAVFGGGMSSSVEVKPGAPRSQWQPVQRWAAVDRPGRYELWAFQIAHDSRVIGLREAVVAALAPRLKQQELEPGRTFLRDRKTGRRAGQVMPRLKEDRSPSPLARLLPAPVRARLGAAAATLQDFARLDLTIRAGGAAEVAAMVKSWVQVAAGQDDRAVAARVAIWFVRQDSFLRTVEGWIGSSDWEQHIDGLAMNPSPRATALLLARKEESVLSALSYLPPARVGDAVPALIAKLDHPSEGVRTLAENQLVRWTGTQLGRSWKGYQMGRPTLAEGKTMKGLWERWWGQHKAGFRPKAR